MRDARGRVESRFRYFAVTWSWTLGTGRGEAGESKYGASSSYNGSAMIVYSGPEGPDEDRAD